MNHSFRTILSPAVSDFSINHDMGLVLMGSCFSEHIGALLHDYKFKVLSNPFGVMYNPSALARALKMSIQAEHVKSEQLVKHQHLWHSFDFHGSFSTAEPEALIANTRKAIDRSHQCLKEADVLLITFGTAWVYEWIESGKIVANCHKIPANRFRRFQLSVEQIVSEWESLIEELHQFNPVLRIVFTLSPVRHLKDGFHANQLSKATLLLAIETLIQRDQHKLLSYFPAYEIMNDDLRDYRYYAPDMVHVSDTAVQYLFEHFSSVYFKETTKQQIKVLHKLLLMKKHRILTDHPEAVEAFAGRALSEIETLEKKYPNIKFELEKKHFTNLLETKRLQ